MKKIIGILLSILIVGTLFVGCGSEEIKLPNLDKKVSESIYKFDYSTYEKSGDKIKVTLAYNGDVLRVGPTTAIRNIVEEELSKDYKEIDLTIMQEKPEFNSVNYIYKDGAWDKEVS